MKKYGRGIGFALCIALLAGANARADEVSYFALDGDLLDSGDGGNDGTVVGGAALAFVEGYDGAEGGALHFNAADQTLVSLAQTTGLPLNTRPVFSIAMWVRGPVGQRDLRIFSEASTTNGTPLFNLGTHNGAANGALDAYIRPSPARHIYSTTMVFDDTWHHIAWVDDNGQVTLYVDGVADETDFSYVRVARATNTTTLGGILRANPSHWFTGDLDDVHLYDHALTQNEVLDLLPFEPFEGCPEEGDTHCEGLEILPPNAEEDVPGLYSVTAEAFDDSGDPIVYTFRAESDDGTVLRSGPADVEFADFELGRGTWTISVTVDDDALCRDEAGDASCSEQVVITCPAVGDTHCDDLLIEGPDGGDTPGTYLVAVQDSFDESGDPISYLFRAQRSDGRTIEIGPQSTPEALLTLGPGDWTIQAILDDDPSCDDQLPDGVCEQDLTIEGGEPRMISHWTFDETLEDSGEEGNHGIFRGGLNLDPIYAEGFDGNPEGAILLNGLDEFVEVNQNSNLPIYAHDSFSIAMWVKGGPQPDYRVWSEASTLDRVPLFNIGTQNLGQTSQVDLYVRAPDTVPLSHRLSAGDGFDNFWHHIAWVDEGGVATLYIDGIRDATDFTYTRPYMGLNTTTIGGILRATPSHWFAGSIDDVRVFNYAISEDEVLDLIPEPDCESSGDTHCGGIEIIRPDNGLEGVHTVTAFDASDDSGDSLIYVFTAESDEGLRIEVGPQAENVGLLDLSRGEWTITVTVDDNLLCKESAADATCSEELVVEGAPEILITHLEFDEDTLDSQPAENDGEFIGEPEPVFAPDRDGVPDAAASFDGIDDYVSLQQNVGLPLTAHTAFSIAMWVRGPVGQRDMRIFSEGSTTNNTPLFNLGTHNRGANGALDGYIRGNGGALLNHTYSTSVVFDDTWHHIAWSDNNGRVVLYVDGVADGTDFSYTRAPMDVNTTTIGGILRATPSYHWRGEIDEVRLYNYALSEEDVAGILEPGGVVAEICDNNRDDDLDGQVDCDDSDCARHNACQAEICGNGEDDDGDGAADCDDSDCEAEEACQVVPAGPLFVRADADDNGAVQLTDGIFILNFLFIGGAAPTCGDAADADDNGALQLTDGIFILNFLFLGGAPPPTPGLDCGEDPVDPDDTLGCENFNGCA